MGLQQELEQDKDVYIITTGQSLIPMIFVVDEASQSLISMMLKNNYYQFTDLLLIISESWQPIMFFNHYLVYLRTFMQPKRLFTFLLVLLCSFKCVPAFSQDSIPTEPIRMRQLTVDDGLSQGFVYDGLQDKEGFIWLATMDGLNRYDGYHFIVYKHDNENHYSLPENTVNAVAEDDKGNLWIGTVSKGLYLMDRKTERFYQVPVSSSLNKNDNFSIRKLVCLQNRLYISTPAGMIIAHTGNIRPGMYHAQHLKLQMRVLQVIPLISEDDDQNRAGNIITNCSFGSLDIFTADNTQTAWTKKTFTANDFSFKSLDVNSKFLFLDSINSLLIFHQGGIYLYNLSAKKIIQIASYDHYPIHELKLIGNKVYTTSNINSRGNILYELNLADFSLKRYRPKSNIRVMQVLFMDKTGNLWLQTDAEGVCMLNLNLPFKTESPTFGRYVRGARTMITHEKGDISAFYPSTRSFKNLTAAKDFNPKNKVDYLFELIDHRGIIWRTERISDNKDILITYDPASKKLTGYDWGFSVILNLFEDQKNNLWILDKNGDERLDNYLIRLDTLYKTAEKKYCFPLKQINRDGRFLNAQWQDIKEVFWLATDVGLFAFDPAQHDEKKIWKYWNNIPGDNSSLSSDKLISMCPDPYEPQKYLWLGTRGSGFNRFEISTGKCIRFTEKDGLANNVAYDILPDDLGHLWISTNMGLSCFTIPSKEFPKGRFRNFTVEDGLAGNEFNGLCGKKLPTGEMFFQGVKGTTWFRPEEVLHQQDPVPVNFISLSLNNKVLQWEKDSTVINGNISYSKQVTLTHDQNIFSISFTSMDFRNDKGKLYSWKLDGFDKEWTEPGHQHEVTYTNLNPGTYTFYVRGTNTDGVWNEKGNSIMIVIVPAWYQTWLFKIAVILIIAGGFYAFYRYRLRQALKLQSLRNNIASDLHDEIGSTLSSISISSAVIQKKINMDSPEVNNLLTQISSNTDNMMEAMSDIVWAVNTKNDSFNNVVNRMRAFAIEILEPENVLLNMSVSKALDHVALDMQQRKNLYLLFKEAINNIAKYASCKNVFVDIDMKGGKIMMRIKDDGKGFAPHSEEGTKLRLGGNGLNNMQKRAYELKGKIKIDSAVGSGTLVYLEFPV